MCKVSWVTTHYIAHFIWCRVWMRFSIIYNCKQRRYLQHTHIQYATVERNGEWFMTHTDFVCRYLQLTDSSSNPETIRLLADVADTTKNKWGKEGERKGFVVMKHTRFKIAIPRLLPPLSSSFSLSPFHSYLPFFLSSFPFVFLLSLIFL